MKTLLALDTATEACSVALSHNNQIIAQDELSPKAHTKLILPMVDSVLASAGIGLKQVDGLVFGRGPGSFTGVRIGCGVIQGLALGMDLPVVGISNLTAMAQAALVQQNAQIVLAAIDARMGEVYFSALRYQPIEQNHILFDMWSEIIVEQVLSPQNVIEQIQLYLSELDLSNVVCVGTGWEAYPELSTFMQGKNRQSAVTLSLPSAQFMLPLAEYDFYQGKTQNALALEPVYLRNQVTWKKLPGRDRKSVV